MCVHLFYTFLGELSELQITIDTLNNSILQAYLLSVLWTMSHFFYLAYVFCGTCATDKYLWFIFPKKQTFPFIKISDLPRFSVKIDFSSFIGDYYFRNIFICYQYGYEGVCVWAYTISISLKTLFALDKAMKPEKAICIKLFHPLRLIEFSSPKQKSVWAWKW